uniref:(northern house mosquito) hypothetical protein n=1 Tax=Culex pipiens TaxID=7175 RepID=A0A8D8BFS0_CULPI
MLRRGRSAAVAYKPRDVRPTAAGRSGWSSVYEVYVLTRPNSCPSPEVFRLAVAADPRRRLVQSCPRTAAGQRSRLRHYLGLDCTTDPQRSSSSCVGRGCCC